ncbi:MAG: SH3 domain-containing protein [Anaerolineae bacterium]|nr:SH3 domain-containing protein [Anaerolineae bacterium]
MSKTKFSIMLLLLLGGVVGLFATSSVAQAEDVTVLIGHSIHDVNIRATPGLNSSVIGILPAGEKATAIGRNESNNWIQLRYGSITGWAASWVTVYSGDTSLLPVTTEIDPVPVGDPGPFDLKSPFNVNIRSEPSIEAASLGRLPYMAKASAEGRNEASSWVFIEYDGIRGWAAFWLVLLDNDVNALPVIGGATSTPSKQSTPSVSKTTPTIVPDNVPHVTLEAPLLPDSGITVKSPSRTNIRATPSVDGVVIDALLFNESAAVVGRNAGYNWLQINRNGTVGWVARWVVVTSNDTSTVPVTSDLVEIGQAPEVITGRGLYDVYIRSAPSLDSQQIGVLPPVGKAELLSRTEACNWLKVRYEGIEGWVAAWVIIATADVTNLPVE